MDKLTTVVMTRGGALHLCVPMSVEDAERWAENGYHVFRLATQKEKFAINHVNSGKVFSSENTQHDHPVLLMLEQQGEKP